MTAIEANKIQELQYPVNSVYAQKIGGLSPMDMGLPGTWETKGTQNVRARLKSEAEKPRKDSKSDMPLVAVSEIEPAVIWQRVA
jgi:hypothetical protein